MTLFTFAWALLLMGILVFDLARSPAIKLDFLRFFNVFFVIYFPIQGILFSLNPGYWASDKYIVSFDVVSVVSFLIPLMFYFAVIIGYYSGRQIRFPVSVVASANRDLPVKLYAIIGLALFFIIITTYASLYGGVGEAVAQAKSLRAGFADRHDYAFLKRFFWIAPLVMVIVGARIILVKKTKIEILLFVVASAGSILAAILLSSRGSMIAPFVLLAIIYCYKSGSIFNLPVMLAGFGGALFIIVGNPFWIYLRDVVSGAGATVSIWGEIRGVGSIAEGLVRNFQAPYVSIQAWLENYSLCRDGLRWGSDYILAIASLVPQKITGIEIPQTISAYNTLMVQGEFKSIVPPGLPAFSLYTLNIPGLIAIPFIYGVVGAWVTRFALEWWSVWWVKAGYAVVAFHMARIQGSGEPRVVLTGSLDILFMLTILLLFGHLRIIHRKRIMKETQQ
jgi:hypothetical protein